MAFHLSVPFPSSHKILVLSSHLPQFLTIKFSLSKTPFNTTSIYDSFPSLLLFFSYMKTASLPIPISPLHTTFLFFSLFPTTLFSNFLLYFSSTTHVYFLLHWTNLLSHVSLTVQPPSITLHLTSLLVFPTGQEARTYLKGERKNIIIWWVMLCWKNKTCI